MYCMECGNRVPDGAKFCQKCGHPTGRQYTEAPGADSVQAVPEKKKRGPIWLLLILAGFLLIVAFSGLSSGSAPSSASSGTSQKSYSEADYKSACYSLAEEQVKKHLKAPSTASFCRMSETDFKKGSDGVYMMTGWVDAENSYGAKLRTAWGIMVQAEGEKLTMLTLIVDGETVYP